MATMLAGWRRPEEALAWVERGIEQEERFVPLARWPAIWADLRRWLPGRVGREQEALESGLSGVLPASQHVRYVDMVRAIRDDITQRLDAVVAEGDGRR